MRQKKEKYSEGTKNREEGRNNKRARQTSSPDTNRQRLWLAVSIQVFTTPRLRRRVWTMMGFALRARQPSPGPT